MSHEEHHQESPKRVYFGIPIAFALSFWFVVFMCLKACDGGSHEKACGEGCSKECMEHCKAEGKDCVNECKEAKEGEKAESATEEKKEGVAEEKKEGEAKEAEKPAEEKKEAEGHH